jgi:murein DD-endopeptidase MepM/ murein hydrolase activator NlpD
MAPLASLPCPPGTLPDGSICVRVSSDESGPVAESVADAHHDPAGNWVLYDQIPRRPDRPADYAAYRYPIACAGCVVSGYDLDRPDEQQRRLRHATHVGHGAIDLVAPRGAAVTLVALEHQQGPAVLILAGPLFGTTVVTLHHVREGGELREYLVFFGHLDAAAPTLPAHSDDPLSDGRLLGFVGDSGSPGLVHLHLEVRRVRGGVDANKLAAAALVDNANTIVCDPRNVLPLK